MRDVMRRRGQDQTCPRNGGLSAQGFRGELGQPGSLLGQLWRRSTEPGRWGTSSVCNPNFLYWVGPGKPTCVEMLSKIVQLTECCCCGVLVTQSCPALCGPMDCSPAGCSVNGILQARLLEWEAIPFSRRSPQPRDQTQVCTAGRFFTI